MQSIDDLAREITALPPSEQEVLLDKVAQLNFQNGLTHLSEKYRGRLAREGRLNNGGEKLRAELQSIREEIAKRDYPN